MSLLIYEDINDDHTDYYTFGFECYKDINVMYIVENSYINVTKLCKLGDKDFNKWAPFGEQYRILQVFKELSDGAKPFIYVNKGRSKISGVYAHPDLAPIIASWVSAEFGLLVLQVIKEHTVHERIA
jgi:hypothetical protein